MNENVAALLPETALVTAAVAGLLAGSWLPRHRQWLVRALAAAACLVGLGATGDALVGNRLHTVFSGEYAIDAATNAGRVVVLSSLLLVLCLSIDSVAGDKRESEFYVLLTLTGAGVLILLGADDLLLLFAGYLLTSIPAYALAGWQKGALRVEAALKYYLLGALLGVIMLVGITVLYGATGATAYPELHDTLARAPHAAVAVGVVAVFAALLFEAGGVPTHFWVPDVTDGSPAPVAAYVTTVPKVGALVALFRLASQALPTSSVDWPLLLAIVAAASMTLGNFAAFFQTSVRRLLAYSTISQVGYLLMAVTVATAADLAQQSLLFYLAAYAVTNLAAFAVVAELPQATTLADYRGLARRHPALAAVLLVSLLGLLGTPPTSVFFGKLTVFTAAVDGGYGWLAGLAVANTVASLFYYLRWLAPAFLQAPREARLGALSPAGRWSAVGAYSAGAASVAFGLAAGGALAIVTGPLVG